MTLSGSGIVKSGDQVDRSGPGEPVEEVRDDRVDQRERVRLELPSDEHRGDDRPPDVVVVAVHLDHRRADDVGEDPLVRLRRVGLVVAEDRGDVVVARQEPAVVDRVVEERLVMAQPLPDRERVVEVGAGMQVARHDRHDGPPWRVARVPLGGAERHPG